MGRGNNNSTESLWQDTKNLPKKQKKKEGFETFDGYDWGKNPGLESRVPLRKKKNEQTAALKKNRNQMKKKENKKKKDKNHQKEKQDDTCDKQGAAENEKMSEDLLRKRGNRECAMQTKSWDQVTESKKKVLKRSQGKA